MFERWMSDNNKSKEVEWNIQRCKIMEFKMIKESMDDVISFTDFMKNKQFYKDELEKKMDFTLKKIKALKRIRQLHELAKSRVDAHARKHAYSILKLTKTEKDEYIEPVDKYFKD